MYYSSNTNFSCHCTQLHQNHWGTEKTKYMLYELFWLPNTNKDVEDLVKRWLFYQVVTPLSQFETTKPHIHATTPLGHLHTYLCGPFSAGEYIFTFIDVYSRYSETVLLRDTSSKTLIKELESIFSRHDYPLLLKTNNGQNLISVELENCLLLTGMHHKKSANYWPRSNTEVEHHNKILLKSLCDSCWR